MDSESHSNVKTSRRSGRPSRVIQKPQRYRDLSVIPASRKNNANHSDANAIFKPSPCEYIFIQFNLEPYCQNSQKCHCQNRNFMKNKRFWFEIKNVYLMVEALTKLIYFIQCYQSKITLVIIVLLNGLHQVSQESRRDIVPVSV